MMLNRLGIPVWQKWTLLLALLLTGETFRMTSILAQPPAISALSPAGGQQGTTVEVTLVGKPGVTPLSAVCFGNSPLELTVTEKENSLSVKIPPETSPGIHWIRLYNTAGCNDLLPFHVGLIPELQETEPNNKINDTGDPLNLPVIVNGLLHKSGEIDQFAISLKAGQTFIASLDAHRSLGSPLDGVMQLTDASGFVLIDNDDDHGIDPLIYWTANRDGVYYLRLFGFPANPNSTINYAGGSDYLYRLSVTTGPFVAYALPTQTNTVSAPSGSWFVNGWNLSAEENINPLQIPGLHWLSAEKYRSLSVETGETPVEISETSNMPARRFGQISISGTAKETNVRVQKGQSMEIRVLARQLDSLLDPVLQIRDQDKILLEVDDLSKGELDVFTTWKAPADGEFILSVIDRYEHAGARHFYLLEVQPAIPRIECYVDAESFVGKPGTPLEIPITIKRLNGFNQAITFTATGLTDQQTVVSVVSEATGESSKKVTLKIEHSGPELFQGPMQIVANWDDQPHPQPVAKRSSKSPDFEIDQFWLTLPAKK